MSRSAISVHELEETEFPEWNRFLEESPDGSVYSTPEYLDALCSAAGGRFRILGVRHGAELAGGVALYERTSPFGAFVAPRLLLYYNGPVLRRYDTRYPSQQTARGLKTLTALEEALGTAGYGSIILKCRSTVTDVRPFLVRGWTVRPSYTYVVPLGDTAQVWARIEQNLRRLVGRCDREGLGFTEDDDFDSFFRLHARTMERKDAAVYIARDAFERYYDRLARQGTGRLYHARLPDGRAIASQLVLTGPGRITHTVSAAGDPEFMQTGASAFLRWRVFETLAARGFAGNDLTDAALNAVTHFKSQLGGDLELCLVLHSPGRRRFRWGTAATALPRRGRALAGRLVRRALRVAPGTENGG